MDMALVYTVIGFGLAGYSVIANDSIQTLGTFIASKKKWFKWYILAGSASAVMIIALAWGWNSYDGDISYGCLLYTSPSPRDATLSRMPSSA